MLFIKGPSAIEPPPLMPILYAAERRAIVELYLGIRDDVVAHYLGGRRFNQPLVPVFGLVMLIHIKGGTATPSAVGRGLGITRATAMRRLQDLEKLGIVERKKNGYCMVMEVINAPENIVLHRRLVRRILETARRLTPK